MHAPASAEEDLRVIRGLIERATVYRDISAPSALIAGLLSSAAAGAVYFNNQRQILLGRAIRPREFAGIWLVVLLVSVIASAFFLWRSAKNSDRPFVSSEMKLALSAIVPNLLLPAAFTGWFFTTGFKGAADLDLIVIWVAFYGLALLSTALFAPRSLATLGWAFLLSSLSVAALVTPLEAVIDDVPNFVMGFTFGLYHLIYAACTWPRRGAQEV